MFRLLRSFSLASLLALALALAATVMLARQGAIGHLTRLGEDNNVALARVMANTIWPRFEAHFAQAAPLAGPAIRALPATAALDAEIRRLAQGLGVLKVKIYGLDGTTLYSSDPAQVGESRAAHPAIARARRGLVTSELIERGTFSAMDGERGQVHLLASYVPVPGADGSPAGVFEVYSDVTAMVAAMGRAQATLALRIGAIFLALYAALFLIVRRGDRLLRAQYQALRMSREQAEEQAHRLERALADRQRAEDEALALREAELTKRAMRRAEDRILAAIEGLQAGVALFDRDDRLVVANPAYRAMHAIIADVIAPGVPFETILRENVRRARFDLGAFDAEEYIARRLAQHRSPGAPVERRLTNGVWEQVREQRLADGGTLQVILDITAEKEREAQLRKAKEEAEQASRAKTEFLANMSHELRTPLNAIIGFGEVVQNQLYGRADPARYAECGRDIVRSGRHLLDLINDILDMSKIEAGRYTLAPEELSMAELAEECLATVRGRAEQAGVSLSVELAGPLPAVRGDRRALKQVLLNLLSNALKFTPRGGGVTLRAGPDTAGGIAIRVADTGIGIPADQLARVFEPFHQVEPSYARAHEGSGLGLSISRRLVELHGGRLELESVERRGTVATVRLPAAVVAGRRSAA
jgi:signal transduction histidine kinase